MKKIIVITISLFLSAGLAVAQEERKQKENPVNENANTGDKKLNREDMRVNNNSTSVKSNDADISSWPRASQMAAKEMIGKYGKPDMASDEKMVWKNKGDWKMICVTKEETRHDFPMSHTDMLLQTINFKVPADKMDDLGAFDGSITFDRTQGYLSARCDKEENNILALNLAYDIIRGKRSAEDARAMLNKTILEKKNGGNPEYMQKLMFSTDMNAADPDKPYSEKMGMVK